MAQLRAASLSLAAAFAILGTATCAIAADSDAAPPVVAARRSATADALQHFFTGGVGGCVGAAAVFPIDLVKTRIQAQKGGKRRYASAAGCFSSVVREEGVLGLYSGLSAQLIGVWPEKAVKLTANDFMRGMLINPATGNLSIPAAIISGAFGGMCQVVFTNPLEIVKIQLQLGDGEQGLSDRSGPSAQRTERLMDMVERSFEDDGGLLALAPAGMSITGSYEDMMLEAPATTAKQSRLIEVVQSIGFTGLYRGALVCASRDMVFSGIYFPLFATLKDVFAANAQHGPLWLLLAGTLAGAPAAYLSTPMDMVKTRLQDLTVSGAEQAMNPIDCVKEIVREEGWQTLFTGGVARVARSAPQFGVTLLVYDSLNTWINGFQ